MSTLKATLKETDIEFLPVSSSPDSPDMLFAVVDVAVVVKAALDVVDVDFGVTDEVEIVEDVAEVTDEVDVVDVVVGATDEVDVVDVVIGGKHEVDVVDVVDVLSTAIDKPIMIKTYISGMRVTPDITSTSHF